MARPKGKSTYTEKDKEEIITLICDNVIINKISFNQAVEESEINHVTFYKWLSKNKELQVMYNYAREVRSDVLFEEIVEIADTTEEGVKIKETDRGTEIIKGDMTEHRRLRIDARKWVVSKMCPKKYGDKLDITTDNKAIDNAGVSIVFEGSELMSKIKFTPPENDK